MLFEFDYIVEPQMVDSSYTIRLSEIESILLNSAGKAADMLKIGVDDLKADNYAWVVSRLAWQMDYRPRMGKKITVQTWLDSIERLFSIRNYRILVDGKQIGLGRSVWAVINLTTRRPVNILQEEKFMSLATNIDNGMEMPLKLPIVECESTYIYQPTYSDIDFNGHCNSVRYLQWMFNALPWQEAANIPATRVDINYLQEVMADEKVEIAYQETDQAHNFEVRKENGQAVARAACSKVTYPIRIDNQPKWDQLTIVNADSSKFDANNSLQGKHLKRPTELNCDIVRFQNQKDKWIAFVGLLNGKPYEIFTGLADEDGGLLIPKSVTEGKIIKVVQDDGTKRYDFQYISKRGLKTTMEGLSYKFDKEFWNYAKLISGVLRYGMPIDQVIKMVSGLQLDNESINSWKVGVERALKKYLPDQQQDDIVIPQDENQQ